MPNHVHVIGVPEREDSLARVFGRTHADYARYRNIARQQVGHFWQARYYSCPMDDWHVWRALAYVETNPVRASIVYQSGEYRWSSAAAHLADSDTTGLLDMGTWRRSYKSARWRRVLATSVDDEAAAQRLREATRRGLPFAGEPFVKRLESETGRCLAFRGPGRPRTALAAAG
jgi:putative transposase